MINLEGVISTRQGEEYQRENFDAFLKKIDFSFNLPSVHIAGTNGKGSTLLFLASIYQKLGYKVGRFISPHFYEINESISINDHLISDDDIKAIIKDKEKLILKYDLSYFEIMCYVAFTYFQNEKVDIALIECGMGGEIDATNIFTPSLSIITSISLEHTDFLGKTISEIAYQKGGIIKKNVPLLIGDFSIEAENVLADIARNVNSHINKISLPNNIRHEKGVIIFDYQNLVNIKIPTLAEYEINNAIYAIEASFILKDLLPIGDVDFSSIFIDTKLPCRFEVIKEQPITIIDGGHNPEAIDNFIKSLAKTQYFHDIHIIFACFKDKNFLEMLSKISSISRDVNLTTFDHPRARKQEEYYLFLDEYKFFIDPLDLYERLSNEYPNDVIVIIGSLAFAGFMRRNIK